MSKFKINEEIIASGNKLKCICTASTGTNQTDINYIKNIKILSLKKHIKILEKFFTAELVFILMMVSQEILYPPAICNKRLMVYLEFKAEQLKDKKIGVLGRRIGKCL